MKVYKLTDGESRSFGGMLWGPGVMHEAMAGDSPLCSQYWLHAYEHPLLAVLHNPIHADFAEPLLWEAMAGGEIKREGQMKLGCKRLTTVRQMEPPKVTTVQRVAYGIYAAYDLGSADWKRWADDWLNGKNRSAAAAWAAAATWAARAAEAAAATWAAEAAARAAEAAEAAAATWAAEAAAWAAEAAAWAAEAAAWAAEAAPIDLIACAEKAMLVK